MNLVETECALIEFNVKTHLQVTKCQQLWSSTGECVVCSAHREAFGGQSQKGLSYIPREKGPKEDTAILRCFRGATSRK